MKQKLLLKTMLLLCALIAGSSSVWADEVVHYTLDGTKTDTGGNSNYDKTGDDVVQGGISWSVMGNCTQNPWRIGGKNLSGVDREVYSKTAMTSAITKVELVIGSITLSSVNSIKLIVASNSDFSTVVDEITKSPVSPATSIAADQTLTFQPTSPATEWATGAYYKIIFNVSAGGSNSYVQLKSAKFYKEKIAITSISLPSTESVGVGGTVTLTPTITPAKYTSTVEWSSDNETVATVTSAGVVSGVAAGTAKITAKSSDDASIKAECTVTVTAPIAVTGVSLNKTSLDLYFGDTETLIPTVAPATATNKAVSWESDKTTVATVSSDGLVTAVGPGTCTITVTTDDGSFTATCDVTVTIASIDLSAPIIISDWEALSGSGYYTSDTYLNLEGYTFKLIQCMKSSSTLQVHAGDGVLTSPTINSTNGYTVIIETASGSNDSGVLTLQIGSETAQTVKGKNKTLMVSTDAASASFTLKNLSGKVMQVSKLTIVPNEYNVTVTSYGWATYITPCAIEFPTGRAYIVKNASVGSAITKEEVTQVPAGTPLLLKDEGAVTATVLGTTPAAPAGNMLSVCNGTIPTGKYAYVLAKNGTSACFKKWTGDESALTGRVVLYIDIATTPEFIDLDDLSTDEGETTGVNEVRGQKKETRGEFYNLNGQRVAQPTKGLYIVNGKKVVVR